MKKIGLILSILLVSATFCFAGDNASFVNLGFSQDGRYFMFGQYGYIPEEGEAYSEIYVVDVPNNAFVSGGVQKGSYSVMLEPGQSAEGALFALLEDSVSLRKRYSIDYLRGGRLLYVLVEDPVLTEAAEMEGMPMDNSSLEFRDFVSGSHYRMELVQSAEGSGNTTQSSFYINMEVTNYNGLKQTYSIGHPNIKRKLIEEYTIHRVLIGQDNSSLIIIIAKKDIHSNIRYMVETVRLR